MHNDNNKKKKRLASYIRLNKKNGEKYKTYLVTPIYDSSDTAEQLLWEDENKEKWKAAMKREAEEKSFCGRVSKRAQGFCSSVYGLFNKCCSCKAKRNKKKSAVTLDNAKKKSFLEEID